MSDQFTQDHDLPLTVLLVDDDSDVRAIIMQQLQSIGINFLFAGNGVEALEILKRHTVDLVVSDLFMPMMSGMMLLHSMLEEGINAPFILVTGFSDKDSAIQALRLGAFDYLEKPIDTTDLISVVNEALKLSVEQRKIMNVVRAQTINDDGLRSAEIHIMKMRALRRDSDTVDRPVSNGNASGWRELRNMFVKEAEPQVELMTSTLKSLLKSESVGRELAYLMRITQSVRMASESLHINHVATLAWSLETSLAACKGHADNMRAEHVAVLLEGSLLLSEKISALASPEIERIMAKLKTLADTIETVPAQGKKPA